MPPELFYKKEKRRYLGFKLLAVILLVLHIGLSIFLHTVIGSRWPRFENASPRISATAPERPEA
jgi:hypothetical protein